MERREAEEIATRLSRAGYRTVVELDPVRAVVGDRVWFVGVKKLDGEVHTRLYDYWRDRGWPKLPPDTMREYVEGLPEAERVKWVRLFGDSRAIALYGGGSEDEGEEE